MAAHDSSNTFPFDKRRLHVAPRFKGAKTEAPIDFATYELPKPMPGFPSFRKSFVEDPYDEYDDAQHYFLISGSTEFSEGRIDPLATIDVCPQPLFYRSGEAVVVAPTQ